MPATATEIYGLVGYPLGHSFSRSYFNTKFEAENIDAEYVNFELPDISEFRHVVSDTPNLRGLNVTIPYKQQVIPMLDDLDPVAAGIGAVNVVKICRDAAGSVCRLIGYNSDVIGFMESIRPLLVNSQPSTVNTQRKALVLGTGGASKAICYGLRILGIEPRTVSRDPQKGSITYDRLTPEVMASHTVIVNTTPLGMFPKVDTCPDIPYDLLTPAHVCYDLVYNPEITMFMKRSAAHGAVTKNGLEMLHRQADAAWNIWNE